jgi:hypothetical protein
MSTTQSRPRWNLFKAWTYVRVGQLSPIRQHEAAARISCGGQRNAYTDSAFASGGLGAVSYQSFFPGFEQYLQQERACVVESQQGKNKTSEHKANVWFLSRGRICKVTEANPPASWSVLHSCPQASLLHWTGHEQTGPAPPPPSPQTPCPSRSSVGLRGADSLR